MTKKIKYLFLLEVVLIFSISLSANALPFGLTWDCVSRADGNWNEASTWEHCNEGIPNEIASSATIKHNVTLTEDVDLGALFNIYNLWCP